MRQRRYILCFNPEEARRQARRRAEVVSALEKALAGHPKNDALAQWAARLRASRRYGRYLKVTDKGELSINRQAVKDAERFDGKWVIETNDDSLSIEDAARGYKSLLVIERAFRSLKRTGIQMGPMRHWLPRHIEAHVKTCVLSLPIERACERQTGLPWGRIRHALRGLQAGEYRSDSYQFFQRNEPPKEALKIFKSLKIPCPNKVLGVSQDL